MEMAFRTAITARSSPPPTLLCTPISYSVPKPTPITHFRTIPISLPATATALSLVALLPPPNDAKALTFSKEQIITSLTQVESVIEKIQEVGGGVLDFSRSVLHLVIDVLKPGVDVALPILQKTGDQALKIASPVVLEASKKTIEALESSGIDTEPVLRAAKIVAEVAQLIIKVTEETKPIASAAAETILTSDPVVIVGTAEGLFITYLLLPPIWSAIAFSIRGYKGKLSPAQALDLISRQNFIMIDIRSEKDKNKAGIPRLPSSAKNKMISIPLEELPNKVRDLVRNTKKVEAEMAALMISYLKMIDKQSNIVIMDSRYSDIAKIVARTLTSLGFKNCWIMDGGFSGNRGWVQSELGTDLYNVSSAEVLLPP